MHVRCTMTLLSLPGRCRTRLSIASPSLIVDGDHQPLLILDIGPWPELYRFLLERRRYDVDMLELDRSEAERTKS